MKSIISTACNIAIAIASTTVASSLSPSAATAQQAFQTSAKPAETLYQATKYDTFSPTVENGGDSFHSGGPMLLDEVITPPSGGPALLRVYLTLKVLHRDTGLFDIVVANIGPKGQPYNILTVGQMSDKHLTRAFQRVEANLINSIPFGESRPIYIGIRKVNGSNSSVVLGNTTDPVVLKLPNVARGGHYWNFFGQHSNETGGGPYQMMVYYSFNIN
jgi:hypothetical protein